MGKKNPTRQLLRVPLVDVSLSDDVETASFAANLPLEVVEQELLIGGVESEPRRESLSTQEEIRIHLHLSKYAEAINDGVMGKNYWGFCRDLGEEERKPCKRKRVDG